MGKGRLEAFSDGVFAIAITLLVLEIRVPSPRSGHTLAHELLHLWPSYFAYVVSFVTIGIIWVNHHAVIAAAKAADRRLLFRNLLLLLIVAFIPFPTAVLAEFLREGHGQNTAAAFYAGSFFAMGMAFRFLWTYTAEERPPAIGPVLYAVATLVALWSAPVSVGICAGLAIYYALPQSIEQKLTGPPS